MRVVVACEFSGVVRDAFIRHGHDAVSIDMLPSESDYGPHIVGDAVAYLDEHWGEFDLMIAHPPCTYLANSGVRWLKGNPERQRAMREAAKFFKYFLDLPIPHRCVENPVQHKYAREIIGCRATQYVQPWMFCHPEQKHTGLWLRGLPKLVPTNDVREEMEGMAERDRQRLHYLGPGPNRWRERSRTFSGIAEAMASQWGEILDS